MAEYIHAREKDATGQWNLDNTLKIDGGGDMIHLVTDLVAAIPTVVFNLRCDGAVATVITDQVLDAGQQTTVTNTIATYKS